MSLVNPHGTLTETNTVYSAMTIQRSRFMYVTMGPGAGSPAWTWPTPENAGLLDVII